MVGAWRMADTGQSLFFKTVCILLVYFGTNKVRSHSSWDSLINMGSVVHIQSPGENMEKLCRTGGVHQCFSHLRKASSDSSGGIQDYII